MYTNMSSVGMGGKEAKLSVQASKLDDEQALVEKIQKKPRRSRDLLLSCLLLPPVHSAVNETEYAGWWNSIQLGSTILYIEICCL